MGSLFDELVINRTTVVLLLCGLLSLLALLVGLLIWIAAAMPAWRDIRRYFSEGESTDWR